MEELPRVLPSPLGFRATGAAGHPPLRSLGAGISLQDHPEGQPGALPRSPWLCVLVIASPGAGGSPQGQSQTTSRGKKHLSAVTSGSQSPLCALEPPSKPAGRREVPDPITLVISLGWGGQLCTSAPGDPGIPQGCGELVPGAINCKVQPGAAGGLRSFGTWTSPCRHEEQGLLFRVH